MIKILIVLSGGNINFVYSTEPIEYVILDHDNIEAGDEVPIMEEDLSPQDDIYSERDMMEYLTSIRIDTILKDKEYDLADLVVAEKVKFSDAIMYLKRKKVNNEL